MTTTNQPLTDRLATYARQTAADTDTDLASAIRAMAEQSVLVADDLDCDAADVAAWAEARLAEQGRAETGASS